MPARPDEGRTANVSVAADLRLEKAHGLLARLKAGCKHSVELVSAISKNGTGWVSTSFSESREKMPDTKPSERIPNK